jgi:hypothetical protein
VKDIDSLISAEYSEKLKYLHQVQENDKATKIRSKLRLLLSGMDLEVKKALLKDSIEKYQSNLEQSKDFPDNLWDVDFDSTVYDNLIPVFLSVVLLDQDSKIYSEKKDKTEENNYEYIPYSRVGFLKYLDRIMSKISGEIDFLDIGSGIGDKSILASLNPRIITSWGIELNQHTFELSKFFRERFYSVVNQHTYKIKKDGEKRYPYFIKFLNVDALKFNREDVDSGRRILFYSYVPIYEHNKLKKMYSRFLNEMKIGDFYWEISADVRTVDRRKFKFIRGNDDFSPIWEKITDNTFRSL